MHRRFLDKYVSTNNISCTHSRHLTYTQVMDDNQKLTKLSELQTKQTQVPHTTTTTSNNNSSNHTRTHMHLYVQTSASPYRTTDHVSSTIMSTSCNSSPPSSPSTTRRPKAFTSLRGQHSRLVGQSESTSAHRSTTIQSYMITLCHAHPIV